MLTREEGERLAQAINALRADWPVPSLVTFLAKRKDRPYLDLALELVFIALDPDTKSPARVDQDGPWKKLRTGAVATQTYRAVDHETCIVCGNGGGWPLHNNTDHPFTNPLVKRPSALPTPEQRAAIDKAAQEARDAMTAAREEAATVKREPRDPEQTIQSHLEEKTV